MSSREFNYGIQRDPSPCLGCTRESKCPGCHDHCEDFHRWKDKCKEIKQAKKEYASRRKSYHRIF